MSFLYDEKHVVVQNMFGNNDKNLIVLRFIPSKFIDKLPSKEKTEIHLISALPTYCYSNRLKIIFLYLRTKLITQVNITHICTLSQTNVKLEQSNKEIK